MVLAVLVYIGSIMMILWGIGHLFPTKNIVNDFGLDDYTKQRMGLIEEYVESLTNNPKIKQHKLSDFF